MRFTETHGFRAGTRMAQEASTDVSPPWSLVVWDVTPVKKIFLFLCLPLSDFRLEWVRCNCWIYTKALKPQITIPGFVESKF